MHLLLTRSALILADPVIFQNPFSRLIKKKKNPGHFLFITTLSESNVRYNWVITATSGRVKQASEIWMICQFISQKCHNFLRWSRSRVFWPPYKTRDFLLLLSAYLRQSRTLHIFDGLELPGQFLSALTGQGSLFVLGQFLQSVAVVSQIHLSPDQQEGRPRAVVRDLRHPLWRSKAKRRVRRWGTNTWPAESHSSIHFCWIQTSFSDTQCSITFNCWLYASKT